MPRADLFLVSSASQSNPAKAKLGMAPLTTRVAQRWGTVLVWIWEGGRRNDEKRKVQWKNRALFSILHCTTEVTKWSLPILVGIYCVSAIYMHYSQPLHECQLISKNKIYIISFCRLFTCSGLLSYFAKSFLILDNTA